MGLTATETVSRRHCNGGYKRRRPERSERKYVRCGIGSELSPTTRSSAVRWHNEQKRKSQIQPHTLLCKTLPNQPPHKFKADCRAAHFQVPVTKPVKPSTGSCCHWSDTAVAMNLGACIELVLHGGLMPDFGACFAVFFLLARALSFSAEEGRCVIWGSWLAASCLIFGARRA